MCWWPAEKSAGRWLLQGTLRSAGCLDAGKGASALLSLAFQQSKAACKASGGAGLGWVKATRLIQAKEWSKTLFLHQRIVRYVGTGRGRLSFFAIYHKNTELLPCLFLLNLDTGKMHVWDCWLLPEPSFQRLAMTPSIHSEASCLLTVSSCLCLRQMVVTGKGHYLERSPALLLIAVYGQLALWKGPFSYCWAVNSSSWFPQAMPEWLLWIRYISRWLLTSGNSWSSREGGKINTLFHWSMKGKRPGNWVSFPWHYCLCNKKIAMQSFK